ncbi:conserved hypothetical protein [Talaromyces stipitatus ATCC 10500]|uniref:Zn(2)-C6 fungal-type domain-containing protein n=1 Tax=Talaromyces stipitatus (strain ATCC 10500 / CBS 375.48 / QM 6759 / NRRL 1006) TaxID=441959 RepID=B8LWD5_TALSN|nr:uncharacterized protein TSTA_076170 [Talaromyces stipitatus ATCC 10500]EED24246.1 conserved hypothetical protein [Talaromyces stipitatus ATCC 10500]
MPGVPTSRGCDACRKQKKRCDPPEPPAKCPRCTRLQILCTGYGVQRYKFLSVGSNAVKRKRQRASAQKTVIEYTSNEKSTPHLIQSPSSPPDNILERELMHRWLTRTAWGFYSVPRDKAYLEVYLPQAALKNSCLMNGILALAAADFAHSGQKAYMRLALEYYAKATAVMRDQLESINEGNINDLYPFALLMAAFNFVVSPQPRALDRLSSTLSMMSSANTLLMSGASRPECQYEIMSSIDMIILDDLDTNMRAALDKLTTASDQIGVWNIGDPSVACLAGDSQIYQVAIAHIKYSFAEEKRDLIKNYCWTIASVNDPKFFIAVRESEPMALLIILYFAVLLDRMSRKESVLTWWLRSQGKEIADDLSQILLHSPAARIPDVQEAIAWARKEVGLSESS